MNIWLTSNVVMCEYCNKDGANLQETNEFCNTLQRYPINFVLGYCIAAAPDSAWDYWCAIAA